MDGLLVLLIIIVMFFFSVPLALIALGASAVYAVVRAASFRVQREAQETRSWRAPASSPLSWSPSGASCCCGSAIEAPPRPLARPPRFGAERADAVGPDRALAEGRQHVALRPGDSSGVYIAARAILAGELASACC